MAEIRRYSDSNEIDFDLVSLAAAGNQDAFNCISTLLAPSLGKIVSLFHVPASERDDLRQEGLIGLYKAVLLFRPGEASFSTFAYLCMKTSILSWIKKFNSSPLPSEEVFFTENSMSATALSDPANFVIGRENLSAILQNIDRALSPFEKRVLGLSLQGQTRVEIASTVAKPVKSVDNALLRARTKLKSLLNKK